MKKFFATLKNIWMIEDLRMKILITVGFAAIYRFGSFVVLPGINPNQLVALREQTSEGLMSLLNMFSGGAFSNASIFALGIMPYITASIVIQLLGMFVPYFRKMQNYPWSLAAYLKAKGQKESTFNSYAQVAEYFQKCVFDNIEDFMIDKKT